MIVEEEDYLQHHGILGMKWGVRRFQNEDGTRTEKGKKRYAKKNLKNAKIYNLSIWGSDEEHNVLYITGPSGSGKSTTAKGLSKRTDSVIHIDALLDEESHASNSNKDFEKFCESKGIDIKTIRDTSKSIDKRIKELDKVSDNIENYGKLCFSNGRRVIIEGTELSDETMFPDKTYFKDKPVILLQSGKLRSNVRAAIRDNKSIVDIFKDATNKDRNKWYDVIDNNMQEIENNYLQHHGILGMKWGERRYQDSQGNWTEEGLARRRKGNPHVKVLPGYSGPAYFVSEKKLEDTSLLPRVPDNYFTKNGYEDTETPRVCFAPSVDQCLAGLSQNLDGKSFYIYEPVDISKCDIAKPDTTAVPDSDITGELWCTNAVDVHQVGKIRITGNRGEAGKSFTYGDKTAELYDDWEYEFK